MNISVLGYEELPFLDRQIFIWYPTEQAAGSSSKSIWDSFLVAQNAPIAKSQIKKPVVVVSHGWNGQPNQLSWLIEKLVSQNYIVLGIEHQDIGHINHWKRAQDVSAILDAFTAQANIRSAADLDKIGIAGFSLGGTTAILLEGGRATRLDAVVPNEAVASSEQFGKVAALLPTLDQRKMTQDWKDSRIRAAFIMAPAWAWLFNEESLQTISVPTCLVAPAADQIVNTEKNAGFFAEHISKAQYEILPGEANHFVFVKILNESQCEKLGYPPFYGMPASLDRAALQEKIAHMALAFFNASYTHPHSPIEEFPI